jgi:hypothetical protein
MSLQVDVGTAYEVVYVPVSHPDSIVVAPVVNLPIGVTFEGACLAQPSIPSICSVNDGGS